MAALTDKKKYFFELLAAKFNREDLRKVSKTWGRTAAEAQQDFIHVQKLFDGMVMYTDRYVEAKIQ